MKEMKAFLSAKALGGGVELSDEILAKVNKYAIVPLTSEEVFARKYLVAHSGIDRDKEVFSPEILADFARSLPGKGFFSNSAGHPGSYAGERGPGQGLFFDAEVKTMTLDAFEALTTERPILPAGKDLISVLYASMYTVKTPENEQMRRMMDAGVHRFISISFTADARPAVFSMDQKEVMFYEYKAPGEAYEASAVYLGAQPGAIITKGATTPLADSHKEVPEVPQHKEGVTAMKFKGKEITEFEGAKAAFKELVVENESLKAAIGGEQNEAAALALHSKVKELTPFAEHGKAVHAKNVDEYMRLGVMLGKFPDTDPEVLGRKKASITAFPLEFVADEVGAMLKDAKVKFPDTAELPSSNGTELRPEAGKAVVPGKDKDFADPANNEFIL